MDATRRRRWRVLLGCFAIAAIGAGCQTIEDGVTWHITLRNDTSHAVVVKFCADPTCNRFKFTRRLRPGRSAAAYDHGDGTSWWTISTHGARIGCLSLDLHHRVEGYVLHVSQMTHCPAAT